MTGPLALIDDDWFLRHDAPSGHPERPARVGAVRAGVVASLWQIESQTTDATASSAVSSPLQLEAAEVPRAYRLAPVEATHAQLARVHTEAHLHRLGTTAGKQGALDPDTYFSPDSWGAALRASGGAIQLVDEVVHGRAAHGFAIVRPPGHHARPEQAMGFCLINHAAVAARHAQSLGRSRVLILDWDVHHGNGTQDIFEDDPSVLYVSLHESPQYPGTGAVTECGHGEGKGGTVNIPLHAGADGAVYAVAFERLVCPIVEQFSPDFTIVSAGYDAHRRDPLGGMALGAEAYAEMTSRLLSVLRVPEVVFLLEGGYDLQALEESTRSTLDALVERAVVRPSLDVSPGWDREIERARAVQSEYWKL